MTTAIGCALLAAVLFGTSAAVEQRQAAAAPDSAAGRLRLLGLLIRQPLWLTGVAVQIGGFVMHAVALRFGSLAIVQMVTAAELIVSVALIRVRSGRPLPPNVWIAGTAVLAGIMGFLASTSIGHRPPAPPGDSGMALAAAVTGAASIAVAVVGLASAGLASAGLASARKRRALLLAVAAGLADTCLAVITAALARVTGHGIAAIAGSWSLYALIAGGLGSLLLTQTAYQAACPMITLPVIAAVNPMASVTVGVVFLGEASRLGLVRAIAAGIVALVTGAAIVCLARSAPAVRPEPPRSAAGRFHSAEAVLTSPADGGGGGGFPVRSRLDGRG